MKLEFIVDESYEGKTVKHLLRTYFNLSHRLINRLKYNDRILLNGVPVHVNRLLTSGDKIEAVIEFNEESDAVIPENINLDIIYEDDSVIAINKQPGMVVHPTSSHPTGTVANGLMKHFHDKCEFIKIRPVSRLDRDTSGVIVFAKNQYVQDFLVKQMNNNGFEKEYVGIVSGILKNPSGTIEGPIARKPGSIMLRCISENGHPSITRYEVIEYLNNATFVKFFPITGRTHQIRVHCQAIGHPLIGDSLYTNGNEASGDNLLAVPIINRHALHSRRVTFLHPVTGKTTVLVAPIPSDILGALEILRK